jgi:hypothetical protein
VRYCLMASLVFILSIGKRVRQDDPLSLYLLLLVAEGLNKILSKGIDLGHFEGSGPPILIGKKILNL